MTLKNEKIILGLGLIAGVAGLTQGVSADEVKESSSQETRVENAQVSEADLRSAEAQLDATANALNSAVRAEQEARANIARAENTVSEAQAEVAKVEEIAKTATPENIEKAKTEIANQEKAIASQNDVVANKTAEQDSAKTAEKAQEAEVNKASAVTAEKEKAVSKADEAVKTAEDVLNGTGLDKAREAQTKAVQEEAEAKSSLALAKETLERAEADAKNREQAIQNAQTAVFKAQASVDEAGAEVTTARQDVERAHSDHNTALATLNRAQDAVQSQNKITVPTAFVEAVKKYIEVRNGDVLASDWSDKIDQAYKDVLAVNTAITENKNNVYKPTVADKADTTVYDVNKLPNSVKNDLALFGADLINQIRREIGVSEYVVTPSSQEFAYKVAKEYVDNQFSSADESALESKGGVGHYAEGINRVAKEYGFKTSSAEEESKGMQYYENSTSTGGIQGGGDYSGHMKTATLVELKESVYNAIKMFIGTRKDFSHLSSVLGLRNDDRSTQKYLGIAVSHSKDLYNVHFINGLTEQEVAKNANFNTTPLANPYDSKQAEQALKDARNQVGQTKAVKDDAETKYNTAVSNQATAQAVLRSAESVLAEVSSGADRVTPAKETLARAEVRYNTAVSTLATANATVSALTASVAEKEKALEGAKEALATVQKELSLAQSNEATEVAKLKVLTERVASATTAVETETKALETLRNQLAEMKTNLDIMENAPARLTDAKARVAVAEKTLEEAKAVLDKAVSELEDAKAKNAVAEAHHAKVLEAYKAYMNAKQEAIRQAQIKAEYDRLVRQGVTPIPVVNERGEVVGYQAPQVESQKAPVLTPVQKEVSQYTNQSLPKTGSQEGGFLAMLGLTLSTFGIAGFKKKIRRE